MSWCVSEWAKNQAIISTGACGYRLWWADTDPVHRVRGGPSGVASFHFDAIHCFGGDFRAVAPAGQGGSGLLWRASLRRGSAGQQAEGKKKVRQGAHGLTVPRAQAAGVSKRDAQRGA